MTTELLTSTSPSVIAFVEGMQKIVDAGCGDHKDPSNVGAVRLDVREGQTYLKVVRIIVAHERAGIKGGSVFCFIRRDNGDTLKPASWAAPAKGARGNLSDLPRALIVATPFGYGYRR